MFSRKHVVVGIAAGVALVVGAVVALLALRSGGDGGVIEGAASARAIPNLPSIPATDGAPPALEQHPRYAIPLSTTRLWAHVAEDATIGQLNDALADVGAKIVASTACLEVTCNATGAKVIVEDPEQVVRCQNASMSGFDSSLGWLEIEVDDAGSASETLWDHPAIRAVAYRAERGMVMTRLPCAADQTVSSCKSSMFRNVPSGPLVEGSFGRAERGVALSTFDGDAKVADVNAVLREHDVLVLGALGIGIYTLRLSARDDALERFRNEAIVKSAARNVALERDGDQPKPKAERRKRAGPFSTRPVPCGHEPEVDEDGHRIIAANVTVRGAPYLHRAFIARAASEKQRWPASLNVGDKVRSGRTQVAFAACWGVPGKLNVVRIEEASGATKVVLESFERGVKLGGQAPGLVIELPGNHDRVVFEDEQGRPLAVAPEGPPPPRLDERRRPTGSGGPRRDKQDLLGVGKTRDRPHGVWIVTDQEMLDLYWGTLSIDGSSAPRVDFSSGAVALMTFPSSVRFYDAVVMLGACEEPKVKIMSMTRDEPSEEGTLVAVQLLGSPAWVELIGGRGGREPLAEGSWGAPGPTR